LHSTPNTDDAEGWHGLLGALTDDELARYGEIAADQRRQEWRHAWAQLLLSGASVAFLAWAVIGLTVKPSCAVCGAGTSLR
jgi:hypothetical protein